MATTVYDLSGCDCCSGSCLGLNGKTIYCTYTVHYPGSGDTFSFTDMPCTVVCAGSGCTITVNFDSAFGVKCNYPNGAIPFFSPVGVCESGAMTVHVDGISGACMTATAMSGITTSPFYAELVSYAFTQGEACCGQSTGGLSATLSLYFHE